MHPVSDRAGPAEIAERAIRSGEDMLLMSPDVPAAERALLARMNQDTEFRAMVAGAVQRILAAKKFLTRPAAPPSGC
jgi:beta-glucosidase-like glycosyl hydrolase